MSNHYAQPTLVAPPTPLAIPQGVYFGIDQKYYEPQEANITKERVLKRHGTNVQLRRDFVAATPPLSLDTGSLKTNYMSYLYQSRTGYDSAHPADVKTAPVEVMFR